MFAYEPPGNLIRRAPFRRLHLGGWNVVLSRFREESVCLVHHQNSGVQQRSERAAVPSCGPVSHQELNLLNEPRLCKTEVLEWSSGQSQEGAARSCTRRAWLQFIWHRLGLLNRPTMIIQSMDRMPALPGRNLRGTPFCMHSRMVGSGKRLSWAVSRPRLAAIEDTPDHVLRNSP